MALQFLAVAFSWHVWQSNMDTWSVCNEMYTIIGIKHDFLYINICWAPREMLKPEPEKQGFQHLPMLMYQKSMFDRYYCIKHCVARKLWRKCFEKFFFSCTYNGTKRHVTCERFENAASRAKTNIILMSRNYVCYYACSDDDISFCDGPRILIRKTAKLCINSLWIALFVPVKT